MILSTLAAFGSVVHVKAKELPRLAALAPQQRALSSAAPDGALDDAMVALCTSIRVLDVADGALMRTDHLVRDGIYVVTVKLLAVVSQPHTNLAVPERRSRFL